MNNRKIIISIMFLANISIGYCQTEKLNPERIISGVWWLTNKLSDKQKELTNQYSWGISPTIPNGTVEIDALDLRGGWFLSPYFGGPFKIIKLELFEKRVYRLRISFDRGDFDVEFKIKYNPENDTIMFIDQNVLARPGSNPGKVSNFVRMNIPLYRTGGPGK